MLQLTGYSLGALEALVRNAQEQSNRHNDTLTQFFFLYEWFSLGVLAFLLATGIICLVCLIQGDLRKTKKIKDKRSEL